MTSAYAQLSQNGTIKGSSSSSTVTGLSRWSVLNKQLPPVENIKALHIYDFDNTLFKTPLPNAALWTGTTIGSLSSQDVLVNGGWWHDSRILAATGDGADAEEKRAWEGWWNETIVELVRLSTSEKDALCVLLTGRSERGFAELIKRMINSKGLEFDMVGLKPAVSPTHQSFNSTMHFKQLFLSAMMETYKHAAEIRIYEDRPKHVKGFRDFLADYNRKQNGNMRTRGPITAEVIPVADMATTLDPVVEVAEVQHMINLHNDAITKPEFKQQPAKLRPPRLMIKKTVFFTGYLLNKKDTETLINLAKTQIPQGLPDHELKYHANNILICPRPCPASILEKVGGMGAKMKWEVTGTACYENSIWAACLRPIPATAKFHTDNPSPFVVLALRKGARPIDAGKIQNWHPVPADKALVFETTVGEKVMLRIEPEDPREDEYESLFANKTSKRKHGEDGPSGLRNSGPGFHGHDGYYQQQQGSRGGRNDRRDFHSGSRGGRGGFRGGPRGGGGGGFRGPRGNARGGRGRGGSHHYKSLDDVEPRNQQGGYGVSVEYDEPSTSGAPFAGNIPTGPSGGSRGVPGSNNGGSASDLQDYY